METTIKNIPITLSIVSTQSSGWKTILFNCNCHTFDAVIMQIMRAIQCPRNKAEDLTYLADSTGSAIIFEGSNDRCEKIALILGSIGLNVTVTN